MAVVLALGLALAQPVRAQDIVVSGSALVTHPTSSVIIDGVREQTNGFWFGGVVELRLGQFALTGLGLRGNLYETGDAMALDRDGGEMSARARYDVLPWLGAEASYTMRAFTSAAGYQSWREMGVGAILFHDLLDGAVQVFGRVMYLPYVDVDGQDTPDVSLGTETGVSITPRGVPISLSATYSMERYDFPGADERREQFERISLSVGIPLQRTGGGWALGRQ
jgi:hypothetical protein